MKITSRHVAGCYQSVVDNGRNHGVVMDLPEKKSGDNVGATALEMAGMALAGCISTIWAVVANNSKCSYRKMIVELELDKPDEAIAAYRRAIAIRADYGQAHNNLAVALYRKKDYWGAWKHLQEAEKCGYAPAESFKRVLSKKLFEKPGQTPSRDSSKG